MRATAKEGAYLRANARIEWWLLAAALIVLGAAAPQAEGAESSRHGFAGIASNAVGPFLVLGELSLLAGGDAGEDRMMEGAKVVVATSLLTQVLKYTVRDERPRTGTPTGFPSGHASMAFAMATVVADHQPEYAWPAYAVAGTIAWSRVEVRAHDWKQVAAGAALGYYTAKYFTGRSTAVNGLASQGIAISPGGIGYQWTW
jgi:membrane-associated phospholipid phosphatase